MLKNLSFLAITGDLVNFLPEYLLKMRLDDLKFTFVPPLEPPFCLEGQLTLG